MIRLDSVLFTFIYPFKSCFHSYDTFHMYIPEVSSLHAIISRRITPFQQIQSAFTLTTWYSSEEAQTHAPSSLLGYQNPQLLKITSHHHPQPPPPTTPTQTPTPAPPPQQQQSSHPTSPKPHPAPPTPQNQSPPHEPNPLSTAPAV